MKKRTGIFMVAALAAIVLTACTQADSGSSSAGTGNSTAPGSGTIEAAGNGMAEATGGTAEAAGSDASAGLVEQNTVTGDGSGIISNEMLEGADTVEVPGEEPYFEGGVTVEDEEETDTSVDEENLSDEDLDAMSEDPDAVMQDDGWVGSYLNENEETLIISEVDDTSVSFAFTNAAISGTAELDGTQAIYHGDDYHVVVFEYAGTDIKVTVTSEEDFDASESPLNGVYVRQ